MSSPDGPQYDSWPCRLYCERLLVSNPSLEAIAVDVADLISGRLDRRPLRWHVGAFPAHEIPEGGAAVEDLRVGRTKGIPVIVANHPTSWDLFLAAQESLVEGVQYLDVTLPGPTEEQWLELVPMMELVRDVSMRFGAYVGTTEDAALQRAYVRDRPERLVRAQMEREGLAPSPGAVADGLVPGGSGPLDSLPELRHHVEVDRSAVPSAVYWINWWSAPLVAALGPDVVRSAGWAHLIEGDDGSMTLATGESPPDLGDAAEVGRLARLVDSLALREAQDRHTTARAL